MRHRELGFKLAGLTLGMFFFGFALVPLYDVFCEVTGLGGKTSAVPTAAAENVDESRSVRLEFVASVDSHSPFEFEPAVSSMQVHPGQFYDATYHARNLTQSAITSQAVPSVAPGIAARHLRKVECFCFTTQAFAPGETKDMGVRFLIDPELPDYIDTLTLSYTLFRLPE
jgi:cytochrome c oxidase assembly protein subunit 11